MLDKEQDKKDETNVRLIDEERFVRRVVEGVLYKRKRNDKKAKKKEQKNV